MPLGTFNFSGDLGKAALPAAVALLVAAHPWRHVLWLVAGLGLCGAGVIARFLPVPAGTPVRRVEARASGPGRGGFPLLFAIGVLDTGVRMGVLTFLPFLIKAKGGGLRTVGLALALVFLGGAAGKFVCGWLGGRIGVLWAVLLTEGGTAAAILLLRVLPAGLPDFVRAA
jgi:predicted MFS family arabinose efflux permease